ARGELHQRVEIRARKEFAGVGEAFNRMADQLEQRLDELEEVRRRRRQATARFGEVLAATHDVEQLLRVKDINDRYGHPFGDLVLRGFTETLAATVRDVDLAGRW